MSSDKALQYPDDRKYTASHEWVKLDGERAVIGITDYAQDALGDVVFVELPVVGMTLNQGDALGVVESVKAASDVFVPISGEVETVNDALTESPELVNKDPFGDGWFIRLHPTDASQLDQLMDAATYKKKIESGEIH